MTISISLIVTYKIHLVHKKYKSHLVENHFWIAPPVERERYMKESRMRALEMNSRTIIRFRMGVTHGSLAGCEELPIFREVNRLVSLYAIGPIGETP